MSASSQAELRVPAQETEAPPQSKRRWIILGGILAIAAIGSTLYYNHAKFREETDDAQLDGHLHAVSARVGGTVISLKVKDNQYVKAGDILLEIDPKDYQVALDGAKADLAEAQATTVASNSQVPITQTTTSSQLSGADAAVLEARTAILSGEKQVDAAQARLLTAKAAVAQAQANANRDKRDLERYRTLLAKDEISQQQFDTTKAATDASNAQLEGASAQVKEAEQAIHVAKASVAERQARLARAEADARAATTAPQQVAVSRARAQSNAARVLQMQAAVERGQLNLGYTVVRAAVNGLVSQRTVEVGQVIQPGQPLLAVVPLDDVWVVANYKESQLSRMRPGQPVEIHVDAFKSKKFTGKVDSIAAATGARFSLLPPENATGNYVKVVQRVPVKIVFDSGQDPEHLLRPGMSVVPTVLTN